MVELGCMSLANENSCQRCCLWNNPEYQEMTGDKIDIFKEISSSVDSQWLTNGFDQLA
jgi:hypothetical protein